MANKKLKVGGGELKLPAKKVKGDKKPKWHGKIGKGKSKPEEAAFTEHAEQVVETPAPVVEESAPVAEQPFEATATETTQEQPVQEPAALEPAPTVELTAEQPAEEPPPATDTDPAPSKNKKLKVKADLKPKKMSMMTAALQVLQDRKVPMTCPEMIDVMATEGLWTSPGGKTPASTLYAAIGRSIKDLGKASPFRKTDRGKFEAKILTKD